ncbi:hypothetical protein SAMN04487970_103831 [Paenibacillus tianmuensis]|uniref:Uncharacterized protein n=1 Tax=Paenibacillus tianmuensis TaxID=624147 RepID=A0A1G4SZA7_9BACL|nr:hypothetical protein [Paenibacillus tianmuensis]SCW74366.1 hypothetical protein SAMN04487970_103831 [Paenibacillus tianmuensis]
MTTKTAVLAEGTGNERNVGRLVALMTATAWVLLGIGLLLSLLNLHDFNDRNTSLMVGFGFMVGSVHIYVIRTAIHLVHSRAKTEDDSK